MPKTSDMRPAQLAQLIRQHGAYEVARIVGEFDKAFLAGLRDGWNVLRWRVESTGGALVFWHAALDTDAVATAPDDLLDALTTERAAVTARLREPLANLTTDLAAWNALSRRAGEIDREIATLTGAAYGIATGRTMGRKIAPRPSSGREYPDAMILCVNAPASERALWEPVTIAAAVPTTLLMCPQEMPF